jgi:hypothetical protein
VQPVVERPTEAVPPVPPAGAPPVPPTGGGGGGGAAGGGSSGGKIAAIVIVVLAILGVGGFLLLSGDDDEGDEVSTEEEEDEDEEITTTTEAEEETTTTTAPEETTTSSTTATTAPSGELVFTGITDDTGQLVVEVPDTWTDVDGTSLGDGAPNVQASTDLAAFRQTQASGISYTLLNEPNVDPNATLDFLTSDFVDSCTVQERQDYDDSVFVGRLQELSDCGGQGITLVVIVASNAGGQSVEVSTVIVPPDEVDPIVQRIIETFNLQ